MYDRQTKKVHYLAGNRKRMLQVRPGQTVIAWNIYNDVMAELKRHEYKGQPLQETVARIYRMTASVCDMETIPGKGRYRKVSVHLTEEEKALGQQALFC